MPKTFKYRIYPTKTQEHRLLEQLETCCFIYNRTLEIRKNTWEQEHKSISLYDSQKIMAKWTDIPGMEKTYSQVLQQVQVRVDLAYKAFFRRCKAGENPGYPRFKSLDRYDSFTFPQLGYALKPEKETIYLSKTGHVPIVLHRPCPGKIKTCTVQRTATNKWFVCLVVETPEPAHRKRVPVTGKMVGIDLGLKTYIQASDGFKVPRQRFFKAGANRLARAQRKLNSIDKKGLSKKPERQKAKKVRAHIHETIANCRRDFCHKTVNDLLKRYDFIVAEKLDTKNMLEQKKFSNSIADASWAQLIQILSYKAVEAGKTVVLVSPRNTTQMCSQCRSIVPKDLSVRIHNCPHCGLKMDRDLNASLNILRLGLESIEQPLQRRKATA